MVIKLKILVDGTEFLYNGSKYKKGLLLWNSSMIKDYKGPQENNK